MNEELYWKGKSSYWLAVPRLIRICIRTAVMFGVVWLSRSEFPSFFNQPVSIHLPVVDINLTSAFEVAIAFIVFQAVVGLMRLAHFLLDLACSEIEITSERVTFRLGIFSKFRKSIELYRVKDIVEQQSILWRMLGLHDISLVSSDTDVKLLAMSRQLDIYEHLRKNVEEMRARKGVREIDNR